MPTSSGCAPAGAVRPSSRWAERLSKARSDMWWPWTSWLSNGRAWSARARLHRHVGGAGREHDRRPSRRGRLSDHGDRGRTTGIMTVRDSYIGRRLWIRPSTISLARSINVERRGSGSVATGAWPETPMSLSSPGARQRPAVVAVSCGRRSKKGERLLSGRRWTAGVVRHAASRRLLGTSRPARCCCQMATGRAFCEKPEGATATGPPLRRSDPESHGAAGRSHRAGSARFSEA